MTGNLKTKAASAQSENTPFVAIVDDDSGVRAALDSLFRSIGLETRLFGSAAELLEATLPRAPGCLILDVRLPTISGLDFQGQLSKHGIELPVVFMTGHGDRSGTRTCSTPLPARSSGTDKDEPKARR